jgi:hypothetical protein
MKPLETIRQDIEDLRELILSLDDEIWDRVDHRDDSSLASFLSVKQRINQKIKDFQRAAGELLDVLAELPSSQLPESVVLPPSIKEKETIASLSRPFTGLKPTALLWDGERLEPAKSWKALWQRFIQEFHTREPKEFEAHLVQSPCIAQVGDSDQGFFTPYSCGGRWFECNLSAENIRQKMRTILAHARIDFDHVKVMLRGNPDTQGTIFEEIDT